MPLTAAVASSMLSPTRTCQLELTLSATKQGKQALGIGHDCGLIAWSDHLAIDKKFLNGVALHVSALLNGRYEKGCDFFRLADQLVSDHA